MIEFGNVYEVFELGDLVKINNVRNIHCGRTGTIIGISHTGPNDVCYGEDWRASLRPSPLRF